MAIWEYFVLGAIGILCVFSLAIGLEKMMKVIIGNYLLAMVCLALPMTIDRFLGWFGAQLPEIQQSVGFLFTNKTLVVLVVYFLLLMLIFVRSRIYIGLHVSGLKKVFYMIIAIPLTIVSIALTLEIAILGIQALNPTALTLIAAETPVPFVYKQLIQNTPIILFFHALTTILLLSDIKISLPKRKKPSGGFSAGEIHIDE